MFLLQQACCSRGETLEFGIFWMMPRFESYETWEALRQSQELGIGKMSGNSWIDRFLIKVLITIVRGTGLYKWGKRNALNVTVKECDVLLHGLPRSFDGYRILHLTDLHLDALPEVVDVVSELLKNIDANLCVMTGDYRESLSAPPEAYVHHLERLLGFVNCPDGVLATLGNHDSISVVPELESLGINVLGNRSIKLERGESHLIITGIDDPSFFFSDMACKALEKEQGPCKILLAHSPEMAVEAALARYHFYLAGHTHGGQIAFPGGRPIITRLSRCKDFSVGSWELDEMVGYTSCGVGVGNPAIRFNTRGEVTVFTLRVKNK